MLKTEQRRVISKRLGRIFAASAAPTTVPPEPIATLGGKLSLAYKEWRAGDE